MDRSDVELMVNTFYAKVRNHQQLGPIFNGIIEDWEDHLSKLADFWETNLFFIRKYKGNPLRAHLQVDQVFAHSISQVHFGYWLELWFSTIDELFVGEKAHTAKERARKMSHNIFMRMFEARKHTELNQ
jgi:hemoglobin